MLDNDSLQSSLARRYSAVSGLQVDSVDSAVGIMKRQARTSKGIK